jgi:3-oxoacyl-[acyl-carrier protein] reductase
MELKGSVAIVTGGTGGLGRRICLALAKAGSNVSLVYVKSKDAAEAYAAELSAGHGIKAIAVQADVTTQEGIDKMVGETMAAFGRIDSLVLDAAFNKWIPFAELDKLDVDTWNYIMNYNVTAPYLAMRTVGPIMKKQGQGRIVNITSVAGYNPTGSSIAYAVSKCALNHLTKCMAVALAPEVIVNAVAPGLMEGTRMTANLDPEYVAISRTTTALQRAADKDDVADAVVTFIRTDSITGQTLVVDAGKVYH